MPGKDDAGDFVLEAEIASVCGTLLVMHSFHYQHVSQRFKDFHWRFNVLIRAIHFAVGVIDNPKKHDVLAKTLCIMLTVPCHICTVLWFIIV